MKEKFEVIGIILSNIFALLALGIAGLQYYESNIKEEKNAIIRFIPDSDADNRNPYRTYEFTVGNFGNRAAVVGPCSITVAKQGHEQMRAHASIETISLLPNSAGKITVKLDKNLAKLVYSNEKSDRKFHYKNSTNDFVIFRFHLFWSDGQIYSGDILVNGKALEFGEDDCIMSIPRNTVHFVPNTIYEESSINNSSSDKLEDLNTQLIK